jgi:chromosome segregation ATPase
MKHLLSIAIFLSLILVTAVAAAAQTTTEQPSTPSAARVEQFAVELARLKQEVTELRLELQQAKVGKLEKELQQLQTDRRRLETRRAELQQEIATIDQHLGLPLEADERSELESRKTVLTEKAPEKLRVEEQRLTRQELELSGHLQQGQDRLQELKGDLDQLQDRQGRR